MSKRRTSTDKAADVKDVEGNRLRSHPRAADVKDVEGSRLRGRATETKDVEGHSFLIDPHSARQVSRDRSAEVERQARERARQKEARPNKQHQD
jgi:hypothetical protein